MAYFEKVGNIQFEGKGSDNPLRLNTIIRKKSTRQNDGRAFALFSRLLAYLHGRWR